MKNINYHIIYIFFIISYQNCFSQEQKIYDGKYNEGFAKYEYFEDENLERTLNGNFEYSYNHLIGNKDDEQNTYKKGNYKNNKRTGLWTFKSSRGVNQYKNFAEGNYENDKKNGIWKTSKKEFSVINEISIEFKNDTIINYVNKSKKFNFSIDELGNLNGNFYYFNEPRTEIIAEFYKGYIIKYISRDIETGEIDAKYLPKKDEIINAIENPDAKKFKSLKYVYTEDFRKIFQISDGKFLSGLEYYFTEVETYFDLFYIPDLHKTSPFGKGFRYINRPKVLINLK